MQRLGLKLHKLSRPRFEVGEPLLLTQYRQRSKSGRHYADPSLGISINRMNYPSTGGHEPISPPTIVTQVGADVAQPIARLRSDLREQSTRPSYADRKRLVLPIRSPRQQTLNAGGAAESCLIAAACVLADGLAD